MLILAQAYSGRAMALPPDTRVMPMSDEAIAEAARLVLAGQPVAVPTETVYGLAADATNPEAVARIYAAKGRPSFNPLIVHVLSMEQARELGARPDEAAERLADCYWPGPLTLVVPYSPFGRLADAVTANLGTVALRCPAHPAMRKLLAATGRPLAAPSANASGTISPTRAEHVLQSLGGRVSLIIDDGPTEHGLESTIIKIANRQISVLREGPISAKNASSIAGLSASTELSSKIEAPGQLASHYAPGKPLRLDAMEAAEGEYLIGFGPVQGDVSLSATGDPIEAAARLFDVLHQADAAPHPRLAVAPIPGDGIAAAIRDRLKRAAAPRSSV